MLIFLPFILFGESIQKEALKKADNLKLYNSYVWKNLLHTKENNPSINHPSFLLSFGNFTLKNELTMTIESFFNSKKKGDNHPICKYPARYLWIKKQLNLTDNKFPNVECKAFNTYLKKTSSDNIKLVFVSENITNPSSMMGHVFFKISGKDIEKKEREHAVSFFTVIDTINIPSLLIKSTITGMKGFFVLRPYKEQLNRYLKEENRNIWEYDLNLSEEDKQLLYYHFWELKDVKIKYLFTGFNCATIVYDMLSMNSKELNKNNHLWLTPKDVIKDAKKNKIIGNVSLKASDHWTIKMLLDQLEWTDSNYLKMANYKNIEAFDTYIFSSNQKTRLLEEKLMSTYIQYRQNKNTLEKKALKSLKLKKANVGLDMSNYKNPLNTFNDTQASLSFLQKNNKENFKVTFLPASHTLYDDNREYFGESDLRIMELEVLFNKEQIDIDTFNLYSMKSLLPRDTFTGGISTSFELNYESHYTKELTEYKAYNLSGGMGYTFALHDDIFLYTLINAGLSYGDSKGYAYIYPESGLIIYELFNMKTVVEYKYIYNQHNSKEGYHDVSLNQSLFLDKDIRLGVEVNHKYIDTKENTNFGFSINYFF